MKIFDYTKLSERTWDSEVLSYVAQIYEAKGRQELFIRQKPVQLYRLVEIAKIQSTEASNRIEGIVTTNARLEQLIADKTTPRNRNEEEILGYRNVLNLIHDSYEYINVRPNHILQLHQELLKYTTFTYKGRFKTVPNEIAATMPNGEKKILFKPLKPYETPDAVENLCENYRTIMGNEQLDPLIVIPCFILDFLCIHPFNDGNGRLSRLLTLLLLYQNGFLVGQYISIEKIIADTKDEYYQALALADQGWLENNNDPKPFIKYMLAVILSAYREFENRVRITEDAGIKSTAYDIVKQYTLQRIGTFTKKEVLQGCPSLGSSSVEASLKKLVEQGYLERIGAGRNTCYASHS